MATTDFELFRVKLATHIPKQSGDGDDGRKGNVHGKDGNEGRNGDAPQQFVFKRTGTDAMRGLKNNGSNGRLDPVKQTGNER